MSKYPGPDATKAEVDAFVASLSAPPPRAPRPPRPSVGPTDEQLMAEITAEAERMGGSKGLSLDDILNRAEGGIEMLRDDEDEIDDTDPGARRESLVSLAAWVILAIRHEERHGGLPIEDVPEEVS